MPRLTTPPSRKTLHRPVQPGVTLTAEATQALQLLEQTPTHVFLTGRAGTGKSTLLQYFRATTRKTMAVLAPTGVAAVQVQGQTIHSFFGFGPDITVAKVRRRRDRESALFKRLQTIVIDEISMVRADLLDCIDAFLRLNGRAPSLPFGGIQMVFIGDLYQLPPVVPPAEEAVFRTYYASPYFFDAKVLRSSAVAVVELTHVHRQRDAEFIAILDAIRTCAVTDEQLATLNRRVVNSHRDAGAGQHPPTMHLVPTNAQAERINEAHLARLSAKAVTFRGTTTGEFNRTHLPTSEMLPLKPGAQIMMLTNEPAGCWVNGDMGKIVEINAEEPSAAITVELANGYRGKIGPHTWEMIRFFYDEKRDRIEAEVVGSFTQYPLRLAWALTIHKAQGKTFDQVLVDFGQGTFAHGQAYVALSRCRSLEGLMLRAPVLRRHLFMDQRVQQFLAGQTPPRLS
jgi:ATP-dependent exoDNAse (exonuclease V) alpha subunit